MLATRRGRALGAENYNQGHVESLLSCFATVKPTGPQEWQVVLEEYDKDAAENNRARRDLNSSRKKYQALINSTEPTGNPKCPQAVRTALKIQRQIEQRVHMDPDVDDGVTQDVNAEEDPRSSVDQPTENELPSSDTEGDTPNQHQVVHTA